MVALFLVVNRWGNHTIDGEEAYWLVLYQIHRHNNDTSLEVDDGLLFSSAGGFY
jgi:hypothetical protein